MDRLKVDRVTTYPYGTNAFKVCKSEMLMVRDLFIEKYVDCLFYDKIIRWSEIATNGFKVKYKW